MIYRRYMKGMSEEEEEEGWEEWVSEVERIFAALSSSGNSIKICPGHHHIIFIRVEFDGENFFVVLYIN